MRTPTFFGAGLPGNNPAVLDKGWFLDVHSVEVVMAEEA